MILATPVIAMIVTYSTNVLSSPKPIMPMLAHFSITKIESSTLRIPLLIPYHRAESSLSIFHQNQHIIILTCDGNTKLCFCSSAIEDNSFSLGHLRSSSVSVLFKLRNNSSILLSTIVVLLLNYSSNIMLVLL